MWYVRTTDTTGVYVDDSVKVVFIQTNDNKVSTSIDSGKSALKYVIDHLNVRVDGGVDKYQYETSMIVDKGFAKVVIVRDLVTAGSHGQPTGIDVTIANGTVTVDNWDGTDVDDVVEAIEDALKNAGYTDSEITVAGGFATGIKAKRGSTVYNFDLDGDIADPTTTSAISLTESTITIAATEEQADCSVATASNSGTVTAGTVDAKDNAGAVASEITVTVAADGKITVETAAAAEGTYTAEIAGLAADGSTPATPATLAITVTAATPMLYTVSFDANGGGGTAPTAVTQASAGANVTLPDDNGMTKAGYTFGGWATSASAASADAGAASASYTPAAEVADSATTTVTIEMPAQEDITAAMATGQTITITITAP